MVDQELRTQAFLWLRDVSAKYDYVVARSALQEGFTYRGHQIHLLGPSGIWKPKVFELPISVTTTTRGPYPDGFTDDGLLYYRYRGSDPHHRDNEGLRNLMRTRTPFIYFHSIVPGKYVPVWPVFVVRDIPDQLAIHAAVDPAYTSGNGLPIDMDDDQQFENDSSVGVRRYVAAFTRRRLHQSTFREEVLSAYRHSCVFCKLHHSELLDAAHIIPDSCEHGDPIVPNGLCLCKIHHAAYDQNIVGISPEYEIHIRHDILLENDGPMLRHGLQELNGARMILPSRRENYPDPDRLRIRFNEFRNAG